MATTNMTRSNRRDALGQRLLEAVETLCADGLPFAELSVDRLASEAGVSRATFYIYFADKAEFLHKVTTDVFAELATVAQSWWKEAHRADKEQLRRTMAELVRTYARHRVVLRAVAEASASDEQMAKDYLDLVNGVVMALEQSLGRGLVAGKMRPLPPGTAAALIWMVERSCMQLITSDDPQGQDRLADALAEVVFESTRATP